MNNISQEHEDQDEYLSGCPVEVWDGPYLYRCGLGIDVCAYHGPFVRVKRCQRTPGCNRPDNHSGACRL